MFLANGEVGGMDDLDGELTRDIAMRIYEVFPYDQWHLMIGNDTDPFSWRQCETCSNDEGGERHEIIAERREQ